MVHCPTAVRLTQPDISALGEDAVVQSISSELSGELMPSPVLTHSIMAHGLFTDRWRKRLPRRWARNGAVFGAIFTYAQVGGSKNWEVVLTNGYELRRFIFVFVVMSVGSALIALLLGLWARRALSPIRDGEWASVVKSVPRKWIFGPISLGF